MNKKQREWLADGLRELANLAIAAMVFGQFLSKEISFLAIVTGLIIGMLCYIVGMRLTKIRRRKYGK